MVDPASKAAVTAAERRQDEPISPRRGRIDEIPSLRALDLSELAGELSYGHSGYVERGFTREADFYRRVVADSGYRRDERILDIGCGFGRWSIFLAEYNREIIGIDPMAGRVAIARNLVAKLRLDNAAFLSGTSHDLPFENNRFDAAWCFSTLHFADRDRTLAEVRRVLVPGGRLFVGLYFGLGRMIALLCYSFLNGGWKHPDFEFAAKALEDGTMASGPPNFATAADLDIILDAQGFRIEGRFDIGSEPIYMPDGRVAALAADPAGIVRRFREDPEFRRSLLADYSKLCHALDYNLSFLARAV